MRAYIIVQGANIADLGDKVEELVVEGYKPVGGVSLVASRVVQAVYKAGIVALFKDSPSEDMPPLTSPPDTLVPLQ